MSGGGGWAQRTSCRLCEGVSLRRVLDLPATPLANEFPPAPASGQDEFPLFLAACGDCGHVQLPVVVDPERLFRDYVYVSGTSPVFVDHFRRYAEDQRTRLGLGTGDLVVEIGSNDGTLLRFFHNITGHVLGIDPARDLAAAATAAGLETLPEFFSEALAARLVAERGCAKLVVANNVFAHADDLSAIARGVKALLAPDGRFVFEISYLPDVLRKTLFDTIYHEHLSYHALWPLMGFFRSLGMSIVHAERVDTHGGSLRVTVAPAADVQLSAEETAAVWALLADELRLGLGPKQDCRPSFAALASKIAARGEDVVRALRATRLAGGVVAGYGAPAKATTLLRSFGAEDLLDYVVDDSPHKQGRWLPGGRVPVLPSSALTDPERRPGLVLILAWNFADSILAKLETFRAAGGRVLVPLPDFRLV